MSVEREMKRAAAREREHQPVREAKERKRAGEIRLRVPLKVDLFRDAPGAGRVRVEAEEIWGRMRTDRLYVDKRSKKAHPIYEATSDGAWCPVQVGDLLACTDPGYDGWGMPTVLGVLRDGVLDV